MAARHVGALVPLIDVDNAEPLVALEAHGPSDAVERVAAGKREEARRRSLGGLVGAPRPVARVETFVERESERPNAVVRVATVDVGSAIRLRLSINGLWRSSFTAFKLCKTPKSTVVNAIAAAFADSNDEKRKRISV